MTDELKALSLNTWYELRLKPGASSGVILGATIVQPYQVSPVYKDEWTNRPLFKKRPKSMYVNLCLVFSLEGIANGCTKTLELENAQSVHFEKAIKDKAFKVTLEKGDLKIQWMPK